jgi:hypothetical protein
MAKGDENKPNQDKERTDLISEDELVLMLKIDDQKESAKAAKDAIAEAKKAAAPGPAADAKAAESKKGGGKSTKATDVTTANAVRASARALNQSLKRFSGMSTRVSSLLMKDSKKTKQQKTPKNPLSFLASTSAAASSSLISGYALKPLSISRFIHA